MTELDQNINALKAYRCPVSMSELSYENKVLNSSLGHQYPVLSEYKKLVPAFSFQDEDVNEYSIDKAAEIHDNALAWLLKAHHTTEDQFRNEVLINLRLRKGQRVLITGVGAGNDLPYICPQIGKTGEIFAQDYSKQMLFAAIKRSDQLFNLQDYNINYSLGDAVSLPFPSEFFDVVYHFGGINLFSSISKGVLEMERVVKNGGRVVFGDEGLAPWLKQREIGKILIQNNPLYKYDLPLDSLPSSATDVSVNWTINNCYYVVSYTSSKEELPVNLDLPHSGSRGGSLRTRYYGLLEGINPELKKKIYVAAKSKGISRVEFLENLLKSSLK